MLDMEVCFNISSPILVYTTFPHQYSHIKMSVICSYEDFNPDPRFPSLFYYDKHRCYISHFVILGNIFHELQGFRDGMPDYAPVPDDQISTRSAIWAKLLMGELSNGLIPEQIRLLCLDAMESRDSTSRET
ncbi:hypothetical protein ABKN59_009386 [Abortiporus biennis]